jgi:hypothetical protein
MSDSEQTISEVTRRAIVDYLTVSASWSGAMEEHEFLARIYDLQRMPSTDYRSEFSTAYLDIWQHRVRNEDWSKGWVFTDSRFNLLYGSDEAFLRFLAETVHPVVRPKTEKALAMAEEYNSHLAIDGWELYVAREISRKPVFSYRKTPDSSFQNTAENTPTAGTDRINGVGLVDHPAPHHPKAFVSHATLDHPFAEKFAADLRANGVDAWFSKWEIKPGDSIRAKIEEGLEGCEYFIIVLSRNSISRPWVQTELDAATIRKLSGKVRKIIPVKIEDCGDLPPTLASLLWEDFSNQRYEAALKRVLDSIFDVEIKPPLGSPPSAAILEEKAGPRQRVQTTTLRGTPKFPIHMDDLGRFAGQLRTEKFDARTDLVNGQVGLIVGPIGLDPKRMPKETAGLFFPLWELNHEANRPIVDARNFHGICEARPSGWKNNRPYRTIQRGEQIVWHDQSRYIVAAYTAEGWEFYERETFDVRFFPVQSSEAMIRKANDLADRFLPPE